jgi:hypothetical protein
MDLYNISDTEGEKIQQEVMSEIDNKVEKWFIERDKQTRGELLKYLHSLRDTSRMPTTKKEIVEGFYIAFRSRKIMKDIMNGNDIPEHK